MTRILALLVLSLVLAGNAPADSTGTAPDSTGTALPPELQPVPFDSLTAARYRTTAGRLAAAVATGDAKAFRALHTDAGWNQADDWWKDLYANQKKKQGPIIEVVGPLRGIVRMGARGVGIPREGAAILLRFEKQLGASMSFVLDESGRIVKSNSWLEQDLKDAKPEGGEILWAAKKPAGSK